MSGEIVTDIFPVLVHIMVQRTDPQSTYVSDPISEFDLVESY
jgi:hypothetical protein